MSHFITQNTEGDRIKYFKTFKYLEWKEKTVLIFKITQMIENIIQVGKYKYLKKQGKTRLHSFHGFSLADIYKEDFITKTINLELPFVKKIKKS